MKKILFFVTALFTLSFYSQTVSVSSSSAQQLANKMVNTNCVTTSNWSLNSGSPAPGNPTTTIGSFTSTNPNFPFSSGVVMSTGGLNNVPGPKVTTAGDGNTAWAADTDMNTALGQSNFLNASSLQFNFVSTSSAFNFNYVFASDEYGNNQCTSGDGIVILLTDLNTNITTNLATVPGTNQPVSVATIRNNAFNTSCASSNSSFFNTFYAGPPATSAPINFLGQTVLMSANAILVPGRNYRLKIVIADTSDGQNDSAIFMNYAPVIVEEPNLLGPDISSVNNTALCNGNSGNTVTLNTGLSATFTYEWKKNGVVIPGATSPSYVIPAAETFGIDVYEVTYLTGICAPFDGKKDRIVVEFLPELTTANPIGLYKCVGSTLPYNFQTNSNIISQNLTGTPVISYYTSNALANIGSPADALPINYTGSVSPIFVRIVIPGSNCPLIKSFVLGVSPIPTATAPPKLENICAVSPTSLIHRFNLNTLNPIVLNGQSDLIYKVSYHLSQADADNNTTPIPASANGVSNITTSTIYVRVFIISNPSCYAITSFEVEVDPVKIADKPAADIVYCNNPGYKLPPLVNGKYFYFKYDENAANPSTSQGPEIPFGTIITLPANQTSITIYVSNLQTPSDKCSQQWPLKITLIKPETLQETTTIKCDSYKLKKLDYGFYYSDVAGVRTLLGNEPTITSTTTVYYVFQSQALPDNPSCTLEAGPITITIEYKPDLGPDRQNLFICNTPYSLPSLAAYPGAKYYTAAGGPGGLGTEITTLDITADLIANGFKEVFAYQAGTGTLACPNDDGYIIVLGIQPILVPPSCNYTLNIPNVGDYYTGPGGTGDKLIFADGDYVIEQTTTLYLYTPLPPGGCNSSFINEITFTITVSQPPIDNIPGFTVVNGEKQVISCGTFTLPVLANGKYYSDSHFGADPTGGNLLTGGVSQITETGVVYRYDEIIDNTGPAPTICRYEKKFNIIVYPEVLLDDVNTAPALCAVTFYDLPVLTNGNYYTGPLGTGTLLTATGTQTNDLRIDSSTTPITVYAYNNDPINNCQAKQATIVLEFRNITVDFPLADAVNNKIERCTSYTLPTPLKGKFYNGPGGPQGTTVPPALGNGVQLPNGTILTIPPTTTSNFFEKDVYIYNSYIDPTTLREYCPTDDTKVTKVILYKEPKITTVLNDMYFCTSTDITGGDLPVLSGPNISATLPAKYYTQSHLAGGTGGTEITPTTVLTNGQMVYAYVKNESIVANSTFAGCSDEKSFKVNIFKVEEIQIQDSCGSISLASLPVLAAGNNYYTSQNGVDPLTATDLENTTASPITKTIYVYGLSGFPNPSVNCQSAQSSFTVTITASPTTNPVPLIDRTFCDEFDSQNDGIYNVALSQFDNTIKGPTQTAGFAVTYHETLSDAATNVAITSTSLTTVFAVVRTPVITCFSNPYQLDLIINKLPEPNIDNKIICVDNITKLPAPGTFVTLNSNLQQSGYSFEWKDKNGILITELGNTLTTNTVGDYSVTATDLITGCKSKSVSGSVIPSSIAITSYTVTQNFEDNQTIVVIATGANNDFEYSLDGAPFVDSNVFENLSDGSHVIIVRDKNGCGDAPPINALIINYPKFFTPNGDDFNDKWNIKGLSLNQIGAKISIYDRTGKLLKQISPSSEGWDGTYNGSQMPSSDYWFVVRYLEDGLEKEFKSHFSMKR
jgi:gliding motility-associated-like protein